MPLSPADLDLVRGSVRADSVHRRVYTDPAIFALEQRHLFRNTWMFLGHDSQVPNAGDFYSADIAGEPLLMLRQADGSVKVLYNRCLHKGAKLVRAESGNAGRYLRCPYHAWTYHTDGSLAGIPFKAGYEGTRIVDCPERTGMDEVHHVRLYRGFVFVRLAEVGIGFDEFFGESLSSIDNLADRSPEGELEFAGGVLRYMHDCNWKPFIENLHDTMHPMVAHEAAAGTAKRLWSQQPPGGKPPMAVELLTPFVEGHEFFDKMGIKVYPNGHSYTGVNFSIHSKYSDVPGYEESMVRRYGDERAHAILGEVRHNTLYFPNLTIKGAIQAIRVVRPIAADRTLIESWTFRLKGAPDLLLERTCMYTRLINAPTSMVGHDDLHCYRSIQEGLASSAHDWVSLHRNYRPDEDVTSTAVVNGTSELSMRRMYQSWLQYMTCDSAWEAAP
mgnify:CR=1 FL=1